MAEIYSIKDLYFIRDLTQKLKDSHAKVKWDAAWELILFYLNKKDEDGIRKMLSDKDPNVVAAAVGALRYAVLKGEDVTSALSTLKKIYPDLIPEEVSNIPKDNYKDRQKAIIENFMIRFGMKNAAKLRLPHEEDDGVVTRDFYHHGLEDLLQKYYKNSRRLTLKEIYPDLKPEEIEHMPRFARRPKPIKPNPKNRPKLTH